MEKVLDLRSLTFFNFHEIEAYALCSQKSWSDSQRFQSTLKFNLSLNVREFEAGSGSDH